MNKSSKQILWYNLAFMAFSTVWGFGNVLNGFVYFNGIQVIFSWILMFGLYFVPYALMVGELGSTFKNSGGGVSSWIHQTMGKKIAYSGGGYFRFFPLRFIQNRIVESQDIVLLLNEAQLKLGRTVGSGDQSSLILLHDYYGLPVEVILCICEYARLKGKSANMNYIYKIGVDWSQREIDNIEAADEELKRIENTNSKWAVFCREAGIQEKTPNSSQEKYVSQWINEWNFTVLMLVLAYEEMITNTGKFSFSYMHKILSSWHKKGIDTPEKADEEKKNFMQEKEKHALEKSKGNKKDKTPPAPDPGASYDLARADEIANKSVPKVKKRGKR